MPWPQLPLRGAARLQQRLREHREAAYLARSLTRIVCDVPMSARSFRPATPLAGSGS